MRLPSRQGSAGRRRTPADTGGTGTAEYDLYEREGEFVLSIELPGYDPDEIEVTWDEGRLAVVAETTDRRDRQRRYRRTFRLPERIDDEGIRARYERGILDVYLPTAVGETVSGKSIPIDH
jgi:HSP20 family protein